MMQRSNLGQDSPVRVWTSSAYRFPRLELTWLSCRSVNRCIMAFANVSEIADAEHEDADHLVLNIGNDGIVPDPVFPQLAQLAAL